MLVEIKNLNSGATWLRIDGPRVVISNNEPVQPYKYTQQKKVIKKNTGKVTACAIMTLDGKIFMKPVPCTHVDVLRGTGINVDFVQKSGWLLENGNYVWR